MRRGVEVTVGLVIALAGLLAVGAGSTQRAVIPGVALKPEAARVHAPAPPRAAKSRRPRVVASRKAPRVMRSRQQHTSGRRTTSNSLATLKVDTGPAVPAPPDTPTIPSVPGIPGGGSTPGGGAGQAATAVAHHRVATDSNAPSGDYATTANRNSFVILVPWKGDVARKLKAANPRLKVLMYKNASFMSQNSAAGSYSSGVGQPEADKAHPDWFLLTKSGQRFTSWSYSWMWAADIGKPAYQDQWAANVTRELNAHPEFDGVYLDDMNATIRHHHDPSDVMQYPNDAAYSGAMRSFVQNVSAKVHAAGKVVFANMGGTWADNADFNDEMLQYMDGGNDEFFLSWPKGTLQPQSMWDRIRTSVQRAEQSGKWFMATAAGVSGDDAKNAQIMRYAYATALLFGNGHTSFTLAKNYTDESWYEDYDYSLGAPVGGPVQQSSGIWTREFQNGSVAVNPSSSQTRTMAHSSSYCRSASGPYAAASSSSMPPQSGAILQKSC